MPQLFSVPVVDSHATVPEGTSGEGTILLSIQSCVCYTTIKTKMNENMGSQTTRNEALDIC